jgi:hypothetical protein
MTDAQFAVLRGLYAAVAAVGDALGSEATSGGIVLPCAEGSLRDACARHLPRGWRVVPAAPGAVLAPAGPPGGRPEVARLATLLGHFPVEAALVGGAGFRPGAHARGAFFVALFADARDAAGTRLLILFERVET